MRNKASSHWHPPLVVQIIVGLGLASALASMLVTERQGVPPVETATKPQPRRLNPFSMLRQTLQEWNDDDAPRLGAALAFYSMLSIGPLFLIVVAVGGLAFGHDRASGYLIEELRTLLGNNGAGAIEDILRHSQSQSKSLIATLIGIVTLVISATGFFGQLQSALNIIWNVPKSKSSVLVLVRKRLLSFGMIAGICVLLLLSLVVSAGLSAVTGVFSSYTPALVAEAASVAVSFAVTTFLFAIAFKFLPDTHVRWSEVWIGALMTALLFTVGKSLIGLYLGRSALSSTYGAAGSMIVLLVWIYYSAQIVFFGAEFTQVHARRNRQTE